MRKNSLKNIIIAASGALSSEDRIVSKELTRNSLMPILIAMICLVTLYAPQLRAEPQEVNAAENPPQEVKKDQSAAKVVGIKYNCVHVLKLEKTLRLYREILGFKMTDAEILHGEGIEGMLIMKLKANDCTICLSLTAPEHLDTIGPIGNTNHNHFMLVVNDIVTIGDQLKEEGYKLENEAYARDKYTFFTGPNGEIIGLTEYK